jgi:MAPEG family
MTGGFDFRREQRSVALAALAALCAAIAVMVVAAIADHAAGPTPFTARLHYALRLDVIVVAWLAAAIANVARMRFFSERDIVGSTGEAASKEVRDASAILQNTFEQAVLAMATHIIVVATFVQSTALVTALVGLFAFGRLFFWVGYKHGAKGRAFGFALTFYPSALSLVAAATTIIWNGP